MYQKLSEEFIEKNIIHIQQYWNTVATFQKLSESFIEKYSDKIDLKFVVHFQKLSIEFIEKHNLNIPDTCWLYKYKEFKKNYILNHTNYETIGDRVIAYKSCRLDGSSVYNFQYTYEVGGEYEAHADHNIDHENSFGLSAWDKFGALEYYSNGKILKVEIDFDDIAAIVVDKYNKIRAKKIKVVDKINITNEFYRKYSL